MTQEFNPEALFSYKVAKARVRPLWVFHWTYVGTMFFWTSTKFWTRNPRNFFSRVDFSLSEAIKKVWRYPRMCPKIFPFSLQPTQLIRYQNDPWNLNFRKVVKIFWSEIPVTVWRPTSNPMRLCAQQGLKTILSYFCQCHTGKLVWTITTSNNDS